MTGVKKAVLAKGISTEEDDAATTFSAAANNPRSTLSV
jgi:hypothetical protein